VTIQLREVCFFISLQQARIFFPSFLLLPRWLGCRIVIIDDLGLQCLALRLGAEG